MLRFAAESAILNTYVPAASVVPGRETGPLNVTIVLRSGRTPCAAAIAAVSSVAAQTAVNIVFIRPISMSSFAGVISLLRMHTAYHEAPNDNAESQISLTTGSLLRLLARNCLFLLEVLIEKYLHPIPQRQPALVEQRLVRVVRHHEELVRHMVSAEQIDQADRLREVHVAVVVSMNEEDGRPPVRDLRN